MPGKGQTFQILHISDLHVSTDKDFDRSVVLDPLLDRVREDRRKELRPEIVILTGDVAYSGKAEEYERAKGFLKDLLTCLELDDKQLFIVPGNHDVDRAKYRPTDLPKYTDIKDLNHELENYRPDLLKGMEDYFGFVETTYPHLRPLEERLIPFVTIYPAKCGKRIGLVGLNSAWMCRTSPDMEKVAVGEYQIKRATKELSRLGRRP